MSLRNSDPECVWIKETRGGKVSRLLLDRWEIRNPTPPPEEGDPVTYTIGDGRGRYHGQRVALNAVIERPRGAERRRGSAETSSGGVPRRERSRSPYGGPRTGSAAGLEEAVPGEARWSTGRSRAAPPGATRGSTGAARRHASSWGRGWSAGSGLAAGTLTRVLYVKGTPVFMIFAPKDAKMSEATDAYMRMFAMWSAAKDPNDWHDPDRDDRQWVNGRGRPIWRAVWRMLKSEGVPGADAADPEAQLEELHVAVVTTKTGAIGVGIASNQKSRARAAYLATMEAQRGAPDDEQ